MAKHKPTDADTTQPDGSDDGTPAPAPETTKPVARPTPPPAAPTGIQLLEKALSIVPSDHFDGPRENARKATREDVMDGGWRTSGDVVFIVFKTGRRVKVNTATGDFGPYVTPSPQL